MNRSNVFSGNSYGSQQFEDSDSNLYVIHLEKSFIVQTDRVFHLYSASELKLVCLFFHYL